MTHSPQPATQHLSPHHAFIPAFSILRRARRQSWLTAYLLLAPALIGLAIFLLYPIAIAAWGSLLPAGLRRLLAVACRYPQIEIGH